MRPPTGIALLVLATLAIVTQSVPSAAEASDAVASRRFVMTAESAPGMFRQCTRHAPEFEGPAWQPNDTQMDAVEAKLTEKLSSLADQQGVSSEYPFEYLEKPEHWVRQFVGYHSKGRLMIFLNLHPWHDRDKDRDFSRSAILVCDGSPSYFSVEYDVERQAISRISFNYGWSSVPDLTY
jgi:hypothetical protein